MNKTRRFASYWVSDYSGEISGPKIENAERKTRLVRIHFNRKGIKSGFVWTVHTSRECIPAKVVQTDLPSMTAWEPQRRSNPRAFVLVRTSKIIRKPDGTVILK